MQNSQSWICHRDLGDRWTYRDEEAKTVEAQGVFTSSAHKQTPPEHSGMIVNDES